MSHASRTKRAVAEALATALLLLAIVGSGIMGERLAGGNVALALLANSVATGAALLALIHGFGPVSAHMNPLVTVAAAYRREMPWADVPLYLVAQTAGAFGGVALAHVMFEVPIDTFSGHARGGTGQWLSEGIATFGLLAVIRGSAESPANRAPIAVAAYITGAYWFTSSTSFANPVVTLARAVTDTFSGIRPLDVPMFIVMQVVGAVFATLLFDWLSPLGPARVRFPTAEEP